MPFMSSLVNFSEVSIYYTKKENYESLETNTSFFLSYKMQLVTKFTTPENSLKVCIKTGCNNGFYGAQIFALMEEESNFWSQA